MVYIHPIKPDKKERFVVKAMFEVIKYEGDNSTLVYKYPIEDFNTMSQLVVQQAQEAIFYYKGQLADHFNLPGTYTLDTQNIPILRGLINLPFGKQSPFHAVVYFINKTEQMNNTWGVGGVPFIDSEYALPVKTGASGEYNFKIYDINIFMNKLVGTLSEFRTERVREVIKSTIQSRILNHLTKIYQEKNIDLFLVEAHIEEIADELANRVKRDLYEYGIELTKFIIINIAKHEESPEYRRYFDFKTQQQSLIDLKNKAELERAEAQIRIDISAMEQVAQQNIAQRGVMVDADAQAYRRQKEGITSVQEHAFIVAEKTAENEGAGNFAAAGMGVGIGIGSMGAAASAVGGLYADALSQTAGAFSQPQKVAETTSNFDTGFSLLGNVGLETVAEETGSNGKDDPKTRLIELKSWFDAGLIDEEEYKIKKADILNRI